MGSSARAHLAYGYDLGSGEDFKAAERDEYDAPKLPWLPVDEDGDSVYEDFGDEIEKRLLAAVGFTEEWTPDSDYWERKKAAQEQVGVELDYSGHADHAGWALIATASERNVEWDEVMVLDPDELEGRPVAEGWDTKLRDALAVLGITPNQVRAKWLVYPSYG